MGPAKDGSRQGPPELLCTLPRENRGALDARGLGEQDHIARASARRRDRPAPEQQAMHVAGHDRPSDRVRDLGVSSRHGDAERSTRVIDVAGDGDDLRSARAWRQEDRRLEPAGPGSHDGDVVGVYLDDIPAEVGRRERHRVALQHEPLRASPDDSRVHTTAGPHQHAIISRAAPP